jgi:hypothetical protein
MGRVINTNNPGKRRNAAMRTIAEILRRLGQHQGSINDDVRDMVAMTVYCLREIDDTVIESIQAWEKRGYWQKADKFQVEWMWAEQMASRIERMIKSENWQELPEIMVKLFPHFSDIEIKSMTRNEKEWQGAFDRLVAQLR